MRKIPNRKEPKGIDKDETHLLGIMQMKQRPKYKLMKELKLLDEIADMTMANPTDENKRHYAKFCEVFNRHVKESERR